MLDKIINQFLDWMLSDRLIIQLKNNNSLNKLIEILENREFMTHIIKYLLFGVLTTIISIGSFGILIYTTPINENICNFISIILGILTAYILNRKYVFESKEKNILKEFMKFVMARALSSLFDMVTFFIFATCLSFNEMIVKIVISLVVIILNYILSKVMVFNKGKNKDK